MGWWESDAGLTLGDGPLDELHRSLREVAASYRTALERPPTVAELEQLLTLVLGSLAPDHVGGLEEKSVTGVAVRTKKAPRKHRWDVGDVFAIPLPDGSYGFGRAISKLAQRDELCVEYFAHRGELPLAGPDVVERPRLGAVARVSAFDSLESGRWPIIARNPGFRAPDHDEIRFQFRSGDTSTVFDVDHVVLERDVPQSEVPDDVPDTHAYERGPGDWPTNAAIDLAARLDAAGITVDT